MVVNPLLVMRIGELAHRSGVARGTIRYYESLGLIRPINRPQAANNYRHYAADAVTRLKLIQQGKSLGFSLVEIAQGLELLDSDSLSNTEIQTRAANKLASIDAKIQALQAMRQGIVFALAQIERGRCQLQLPPTVPT